jgi:hypothetical protein
MVGCERDDLMPVTEEVIVDLAHRLIDAEQQCVPIEPITALYPDLTEADAYRVQMAVIATKVERGDEVAGKKSVRQTRLSNNFCGSMSRYLEAYSRATESLTAIRSRYLDLSIRVSSARSHSY